MQIWSGKCCLCDIGVAAGLKDCSTGEDLHTGDIVLIYNVHYPDTDSEFWECCGMTAIVSDQYTTYTTGEIVPNQLPIKPFCMGVKTVDFPNDTWKIQLVKKYSDVIENEHWPKYGFSFKTKGD